MELSRRGHQQAAALAKYLHNLPLDALYASPMKRVQQTLAPALRNGLPRPVTLQGLKEVDFGDWTALTLAEVEAKFGVSASAWLDQLECAGIANAESAQSFRARVEPCLREIVAHHPGQQVGVACHGGVIRMLLAILLGWPLSRMAAFEVEYASLTRVVCSPDGARVHLLNFTPWRQRLGKGGRSSKLRNRK